jgi:hypothetical protein
MEPTKTLTAICLIICLESVISSLESLSLSGEYGENGLYSWTVLRTGSPFLLWLGSKPGVDRLLGPGIRWVFFGKLLAAMLLIFFPTRFPIDSVCIACILLSAMIINLRAPLGQDGSDQMTVIIFVTLAVQKSFRSNVAISEMCLWFIALQSCVSYCSAGIAKLVSPVWRSGEAIRRILSTRSYGSIVTTSLFDKCPWLCWLIAWSVIGFECAFPLVLLTGTVGFYIFISWGILFHLLNAMIMGLNTFVWAFFATYPAIWFCAHEVSTWLLPAK